MPKRYSAPNAPNSIEDVKAISSWQDLYKERRSWALRLAEDCADMNSACSTRYEEIDSMIKCLDAAVQNLEISVKQIEPKYTELKKWVEPALVEHEELATKWEEYLELAKTTPISPAMVKFMTRGEVSKSTPTLEDLIELDTARKAGKLAPTANRRFSDKAATLDQAAEQMYQGLQGLIEDFDKLMARSALGHSTESDQLLQDIEAVVKQVDQDYRTALSYGNSQRDIAQASKTVSNHTERLVPTLKKRAKEMDDLVQYVTQARNDIATEVVNFMRSIADITSIHSNVRNQISVLNQSEDDMTTFDYLRLIHQLPYMYASFLAETIRRHEWNDKVKTDSSTLANEMALFQDEESKRRKKWQRMVGSTYGPGLDTNVMGLEVNLRGDDAPWPAVSKDELDDLLDSLRTQGTDEKILEDVVKLIHELNSPTKQQSKRLKAFKNGSIHEAALGRSGLMIRGDDDLMRSLQDDKTKLESKLRTAESRVRRLEDLLHRQSQASRPGNLFQPQNNQSRERQNSSSSVRSNRLGERRRSSDGADPLLRRIAQLENELRDEKQRSALFEKDLNSRATQHDSMKDQIQEVNSTKKDLLENMEALKREFVDERKSLEDEIKALKARLEDTEDEMEHFGESREHEKATYSEKVQTLEAEIERVNKDRTDETLKIQGQVEFLRKETRMQRDQLEASEGQVQAAQEENRALSKGLDEAQETTVTHLDALKRLHAELAPDAAVPVDAIDLADALLSHVADVLVNIRNAESDNSLLKTELEQAQGSVKLLRAERDQATEKLSAEETSTMRLRENISEEEAKVSALEGEVNEAREQLSQSRAQLSDGATGSETLRVKLEEEERRVTSLTEEAASRKSQVGSLEEELHLYTEKLETLQGKHLTLTRLYESRDDKTKDLTQKLFSQNDRLTRLLERTGYAVSRKEGSMVIEKVPRAERSSQNPYDSSDPGSTIRRSVTLSSRAMNESVDLDLLYWMDNDASAEGNKYDAFMEKLGTFDMDVFADTLYQRIKEAEHKARKWQREVRSYRDRAHTMQKDAQEKIAFKQFKEGDLALFLPTRNQQAGAWAAFNVGFPHYFLREQDGHRLRHREWLVARITRIQERVVDLSKSLQPSNESDSINDEEHENPFQLSDGLRWYLIDALEDKPGAPSTPGMGKSTVAANRVEATANIQTLGGRDKGKNRDSVSSIEGINKTLSKSLDSRRSSNASKRASPFQISGGAGFLKNSALASETNSLRAAAPDTPAGTSPVQASSLAAGSLGSLHHRAQSDGNAGEASSAREAEGQARTETDSHRAEGESSVQDGGGHTPEVRNVDSLLGP